MSGPYTFNVNNPTYHGGMHTMQETQGALARLGRIFGPNKYEQVNATDGMPVTIQTIQDYYSGANKYLATTIIEALPDYDSWHFRCCPLVKANGLERRFKTTLVFESHLPDSRAPFGTVNRISSTEETTEWQLTGAGIGLRFEYKYLMSDAGELYMQQGMNVIARSICDYHKLAILGKILATPLPPRCRDLLGQPYQDIGEMMTGRYSRMFGTLSKHPRAYYKLVDWMRSQQARASLFESSMIILPFGAKALVAFGDEGGMEANRAGESRARAVLTQGADSMPTVHGVTPYEESEYPFANDANRKVTKPMERTAQVGWHYVSSPKLELMSNPKYNESLCRSFQALDLSGDIEWKTHKFSDMIYADRNFDQKTGMLKADLLAPLEGNGYETEFTRLGLDLNYTPNRDPAVHPYITVTNGVAKIVYFWGDMDTFYAPEHFVAQLGAANAKAGYNSTKDCIDYAAIEDIFNMMDKAANISLFADGPTMDQGFIAAVGMDYRNSTDPNSLFARRAGTGGNFPPIVLPNGDVSIYIEPNVIAPVYQFFDPSTGQLAYTTESAGVRINIGTNRAYYPGFSTIADLRQLAGSTMYDPEGRIAKGLTEYSKFVDHVRNAFSSEDAPNLMLNPDLCPAHIKVPGNSDYAKRLNIESAFMTAFGRTRRPVAIRNAYQTNAAGAITQLSANLGAGRIAVITNDRTGIDDLASILQTDISTAASLFDDDVASEPLLAQLKQRQASLLVTKFESLVEEDPRKAGLQSAKVAGSTWLNTWITVLQQKGVEAPRITRALNRLVEYLVEHPDKNINRNILQQFSVSSTPDEDTPVTTVPGKRRTRREDLEDAQKIAGVTASGTRKTISLSLAGNVFEGLTSDQLQSSVVIPVSPFDARETPETVGIARILGGAGNYEANASSMENTIFGNHDLAFTDGGSPTTKRARVVGGAVYGSRRIVERAGPNTQVQSLIDHDGDYVEPSAPGRSYPVELAQHGLENRFFAQKLNHLNNTSLSLFQRAYASLYLGLQLNSKIFCKLAESNYTVPVTYLAFKPFITLRVGSAIGCSPDLGITETDFSTVMINVDPEILALNVNTTFESGVGILEPRKLFVMDAVMFLGYEGGSSTKPIISIDSASLSHRGKLLGGKTPDFISAKPNANRNGDVFYLSVSPLWNRTNLPKALDIAGPLDHVLFNASTEKTFSLSTGKSQQVEGMVALHMETNLGHSKPAIVGALDSFISIAYNSENRVNTLTCAGGQQNYNVEQGNYTLRDSNGTGPLGNVQAGTAAALHGEPALTEPRGFEISVI